MANDGEPRRCGRLAGRLHAGAGKISVSSVAGRGCVTAQSVPAHAFGMP
ncbi:hypothetical protein [Burkholderia perseverans]|nr:hypothetical protein [Burkholderia perseverans]